MKTFLSSLFLFLILGVILPTSHVSAADELKVVTKTVEPFVMSQTDTGFSMDILDEIMTQAGYDYSLYRVNSVNELLSEVERGDADLAMAAITINADRLNKVDFSHPFYDSGLNILVPASNGKAKFSLDMFLPFLKVLLILFFAMFVAAHLVWFTEHKENPDFSKSYVRGIWDAFWWSAVTVTTVGYGDKAPKKVSGKIVGII